MQEKYGARNRPRKGSSDAVERFRPVDDGGSREHRSGDKRCRQDPRVARTPRSQVISPEAKVPTVWISDVHLGTRGCNAEMLVDFLRSIECQTLYLVGDIIDGWRLRKGWYWPDAHNEVVRRVLKMAHRGTRV